MTFIRNETNKTFAQVVSKDRYNNGGISRMRNQRNAVCKKRFMLLMNAQDKSAFSLSLRLNLL